MKRVKRDALATTVYAGGSTTSRLGKAFVCVVSFLAAAPASAQVLYDNGPLSTGAISGSGVAAPPGATWSELQHDTGVTTLANGRLGVDSASAIRLADDFVVPAGRTWTITSVDVFAFQPNAPATPSPISGVTLRIWNGAPGSSLIFGDTTTNRMAASVDALMFRIPDTTVPPPGAPTDTTLRIWRQTVAVSPPLVLLPGTYWVDWRSDGPTLSSPIVTIPGARTRPDANALRFRTTPLHVFGAWFAVLDPGTPAGIDVPVDLPFIVNGTSASLCGNGSVQPGELCDDGNPTNGDGCDSNCTPTGCGNAIITAGEVCDDGNTVTEECSYGTFLCFVCNSSCSLVSGDTDLCGDSTTDAPNETCDDGDGIPPVDDGNGCSATCQRNDVCGDGIVHALFETCDDGNSTDDGNGCSATCQRTDVCGDGTVHALFEMCDDGNTQTETCTYGQTSCMVCNATCQSQSGATSFCGDALTDAGNGEMCDDGNSTDDGNGCSTTCQRNDVCGDGAVQALFEACDDGNMQTETCTYGQTSCTVCNPTCQPQSGATSFCGDGLTDAVNEMCDDGNTTDDGNGCSATCQRNDMCGDGTVHALFEACDDGNTQTETCTYGQTSCTVCDATCQPVSGATSFCGDGLAEAVTEMCDDGNTTDDGNGCSTTCQRSGACGDGARQSLFEICDDGNTVTEDCTYGLPRCQACNATCQSQMGTTHQCGDGTIDVGNEVCDDGNMTDDGNGCSATCARAGTCGDGIAQSLFEQCDDANMSDMDGCLSTCETNVCGDGFRNAATEACDDGNGISDDGCDSNCTITACGNGIVTSAETCDDGNTASGDGCDMNCTPTGCGNGIMTSGELCDDGNTTVEANGCSAACQRAGTCGDGQVETLFEMCDDGNAVDDMNGCSAACARSDQCGNGRTEALYEMCDDGNSADSDGCSATCVTEAGYTCTAAPRSVCTTTCGDGIRVGAETCDDGNTDIDDGCDSNCTITACGNGILTADEQCDDGNGADLDGCSADCLFEGDDGCGCRAGSDGTRPFGPILLALMVAGAFLASARRRRR